MVAIKSPPPKTAERRLLEDLALKQALRMLEEGRTDELLGILTGGKLGGEVDGLANTMESKIHASRAEVIAPDLLAMHVETIDALKRICGDPFKAQTLMVGVLAELTAVSAANELEYEIEEAAEIVTGRAAEKLTQTTIELLDQFAAQGVWRVGQRP